MRVYEMISKRFGESGLFVLEDGSIEWGNGSITPFVAEGPYVYSPCVTAALDFGSDYRAVPLTDKYGPVEKYAKAYVKERRRLAKQGIILN